MKTVKGVLANLGERFVEIVGKEKTETKKERTKRGLNPFKAKDTSLKSALIY